MTAMDIIRLILFLVALSIIYVISAMFFVYSLLFLDVVVDRPIVDCGMSCLHIGFLVVANIIILGMILAYFPTKWVFKKYRHKFQKTVTELTGGNRHKIQHRLDSYQ